MNTALKKSLEQESTDELFFYFKHDGAYNFEKKIIAGTLLKERGFNKQILQEEKQLYIEELQTDLKEGATPGLLLKKSKQKVIRKMLGWLVMFLLFLSIEIVDNFAQADKDWKSMGIVLTIGLSMLVYSFFFYKKHINKLMHEGAKNNELLRLRLSYIQKEWDF
ncbi:hypothetical protein [Marinifilum fragile]|uniref:hypothetical protein n=1 Tax=Marinifilum fragile TaxID=570161 RepID=UPI002AA70638|nr:hypothetical protein [Marinifilum fragile]